MVAKASVNILQSQSSTCDYRFVGRWYKVVVPRLWLLKLLSFSPQIRWTLSTVVIGGELSHNEWLQVQ
ncbi:unnamed protein product [Schistosoma mattheei]|uniref:Uncharacterized protein n=1 Tax=Schistosoma mattheei TaxID=31246 RepID=A0AA85AYQ3_9TREM|nr:unnamed protein product [Schistosoma mattheei]